MRKRRAALLLAVPFAAVIASATAWWTFEWAPFQRAIVVSDILSGRERDSLVFGKDPKAKLSRVALILRGIRVGDYVVDRSAWATAELGRLARSHPRALARAAVTEPSPEVRFAFLDVIEDSRAYATLVPFDARLEHVVTHAVLRLDHAAAKPLNAVEEKTLKEGRDQSIPALLNELHQGHCGALTAMDLVAAAPSPADLEIAGKAIAAASADPLADLPPSVQDECRLRIAQRAAPTTHDFAVTPP